MSGSGDGFGQEVITLIGGAAKGPFTEEIVLGSVLKDS
jgi:hypothetical protein